MHSKTTLPSFRLIRSPSNLARHKNINFDSVRGSSQKIPGSFPEAFLETFQKMEEPEQSDYDGCLGSSWKFPEHFPKVMNKSKKQVHESALCGIRRKSMCHGRAGKFLGIFPKTPGSFPEASWKLSGSSTVPEGP